MMHSTYSGCRVLSVQTAEDPKHIWTAADPTWGTTFKMQHQIHPIYKLKLLYQMLLSLPS